MMTVEELVEETSRAVRDAKYRTTQKINGYRRAMPPSIPDRRYATQANAALLRILAKQIRAGARYGPDDLDKLAIEVERQQDLR